MGNNCIRIRHLQVFMIFFAFCCSFLMRVNLSLGIVLMTDLNSTSSAKVFNWTIAQQSASQGAYFISYFFMNILSGILVTNFNNKYILLSGISCSSVISLLTPALVTAGGLYTLIVIRFMLGIMLGCCCSCSTGLMSKWVPLSERSRCSAFVLGGMNFGSLLSLSVTGWISTNYGGWPATFYFTGTVCVVWSIMWAFLGADSPETCNFISLEEKDYIEKNLTKTSLPKNVPVPWKHIILSKACWGLVLAMFAYSWGLWTLLAATPTFFYNILQFPATMNGFISALPFACMWIISFPTSYISDMLVKKKIYSITVVRKILNSIGHFGAALCFIIFITTPNEKVLVAMYIIGATLLSCSDIGCNTNHLDILPNFAGFLMGFTNAIGAVGGAAAFIFIGLVIHDPTNPYEWRTLYFTTAAILAIGNLAFITMGTSKELAFNRISEDCAEKIIRYQRVRSCDNETNK